MGGVLKTRNDFEANFRPFLLKIDAFTLYDFYYMGYRQPMSSAERLVCNPENRKLRSMRSRKPEN